MTPWLLAGSAVPFTERRPRGKRASLGEGGGRQSPLQTYQITGHSGYFLELRVPGRRRPGTHQTIS